MADSKPARPDCIAHWTEVENPEPRRYDGDDELMRINSPLGRALGLTRVGHRVIERADLTPRIVRLHVRWHFYGAEDEHLVDGDYEYLFEHRVGDAQLVAPALAIESVAAGGGSVCSFDGTQLRVGPESAGAWPGPACYGAGGPLTLTDVNLILGRIDAYRFEIPLDARAARRTFDALFTSLVALEGEAVSREPTSREAVLAGLLEIADERMAEAIRSIFSDRSVSEVFGGENQLF